ncbi:TIGR02099 family protein [Thiocapsa imhoffii]|uniref:TIGR02099 family protein n=1 Tax=Thiocapsa imhoffii TaxID=382777 RepID=A0A9X0WJK8_9GAMM|nr:YhdP family protein [Thiocapsa imhoffii]MBK1645957.1 TIGR02099 family protein [Thiocapsa imhoffii]
MRMWRARMSGLGRLLGALGLILLTVIALMTVVARFALPMSDADNRWIAEVVGAALGYEVTLGGADVRFHGGRPRLTVRDILLTDPRHGQRALELTSLEFTLDPLASLLSASPRIGRVGLSGSHVTVRLDSEGRLRVDGLERMHGEESPAIAAMLARARVELRFDEVIMRDERDRMAPMGLRLQDVHLRLLTLNSGFRLAVNAGLQNGPSDPDPSLRSMGADGSSRTLSQLDVIAEFNGTVTDPASWTGRAYAHLDAAVRDTIPQVHRFDDLDLDLDAARVRLEHWLRIDAGRLHQALAWFELTGLGGGAVAPDASSMSPHRLEQVTGRLRLMPRSGGGWQLQARDLLGRLATTDRLPRLELDLDLDQDHRPERLRVTSRPWEFDVLTRLAGAWVSQLQVPTAIAEILESLDAAQPHGQLDQISLDVAWQDDRKSAWGDAQWTASAVGRGLGWRRTAVLPGVVGLEAQLRLDARGAEAWLGSHALQLDLNPLFSEPLALDRVAGRLQWRHALDEPARLMVRNLTFENAHLAGRARMLLEVPNDGSSPHLDLRASFHDAEGSQLRTYLPVGIMRPELIAWLERAIQGGRIPQADLVLRGPLAAYPFHGDEGRFELILDLEDVVFDYLADWPVITQAAGRLQFENESLRIELDHGQILDSRLVEARADLADLWGEQRMTISAAVEGPFVDTLRALADSPLRTTLGRLSEHLEVHGESRLRLAIDLPFSDLSRSSVAGWLTWPRPATLGIGGTNLVLTDLLGGVSFDQQGLTADEITAQFWGHPLRLTIETHHPADSESSSIQFKARSATPVSELARRLPSPAWDLLDGQLAWDLDVQLPAHEIQNDPFPLAFRLRSDLQGLAIELPEPLAKTAEIRRSLDVAGTLVPARSLQLLGELGALAGDLWLDLGVSPARLERLSIRAGEGASPVAREPGIIVSGQLEELDLSAWRKIWDRLANSDGMAWSPTQGGGAATLRIDHLLVGGVNLSDVDLRVAPDPGAVATGLGRESNRTGDPRTMGWLAEVQAPALSGRVRISGLPEQPVDVSLNDLDLRAVWAGSVRTTGAETWPHGEVAGDDGLPSFDLRVERLRWGELPLGELALELRAAPFLVRVPRIALSGTGLLSVDGEASWRANEEGGQTELSLAITTTDTGTLLEAIDSRNQLEDAPLQARLLLNWPGGLDDFDLARAHGFIDLDVGPGRLLEVEPGLGRILGVLNLNALKRRLSMDFTDLYGQGFAFEDMQGRIRVGEGRALLRDFTIDGPASQLIISGESDLVHQQFDQTVIVEPRLGSSVALAGAVAGGPILGAAVYLVDRLAGNPLDRLGRYQYRITGSWTDPEVRGMGWDPAVGADRGGASEPGSSGPVPSDSTAPRNLFLD